LALESEATASVFICYAAVAIWPYYGRPI